MKILTFLFYFAIAENYIFDSKNGLLFQENEMVWVHDGSVPVDISILLDAPREKFRQAMKADCGEDYLVEKMPTNLFGRNDTNFNETTSDCLTAFRTFDNIIMSFLGEDLVTTQKYRMDNIKKRIKLIDEKGENEGKRLKEQYDEKMRRIENGERIRTRRNAAVAGGLTVAGTLGYTIAIDAKSRARDGLLAEEIDVERRRITMLEEVVETIDGKLDAAIKRIRKSKRPIVAYGGLQIPNDAKAIKEIMEGADQEINRYFAETSASLGKEITESILTLKNHRLPLNPTFLSAIKAHCIAYQKVEEDQAKEFCNNFAFHSTRWDTKLRFLGMGITTWDRKDAKTLTKDDMEIKQVIISMRVYIPRMKLKAKKYTTINLGYFKQDNSRWKVDVPQHLVVMPSKEVLELRPSDCLIFTPTFACDAVSLAPNQCGESILLSNSTKYCQTREVDNRKCGYFEDNQRSFVSMRDPGIAQFFHHAPSENVNRIDSLQKTAFPGVLDCGPAILRISTRITEDRKQTMIHYIQPQQIKMRTVQDEEMDAMNSKIRDNLDTVKSMGNIILEMNSTTLELMKKTAITESRNAADAAQHYIYTKFITPLMGLIGSVLGVILLYILVKIAIKIRKRQKPTKNAKMEFSTFCPPPVSNRGDETFCEINSFNGNSRV